MLCLIKDIVIVYKDRQNVMSDQSKSTEQEIRLNFLYYIQIKPRKKC